jgi:hypothetical protein
MPLDETSASADTTCIQPAENPGTSTRFRPGLSGNPRGRPKGSRNRGTLLREEERVKALDTHTAELLRRLIHKAHEGNLGAIRAVLARSEPAPRDRRLSLDLPPIASVADAVAAMDRVLDQVSGGDISPREAQVLGRLIETQARLIERLCRELREEQEIQGEKQEKQA